MTIKPASATGGYPPWCWCAPGGGARGPEMERVSLERKYERGKKKKGRPKGRRVVCGDSLPSGGGKGKKSLARLSKGIDHSGRKSSLPRWEGGQCSFSGERKGGKETSLESKWCCCIGGDDRAGKERT